MVEELDAEECSGITEALGHFGVVIGWMCVAGWMIVCNDDLRRRMNDGAFKYLSWMNEALRECSDGHDFSLDFLISGIEIEYDKMLFLEKTDIGTPPPNIFCCQKKECFFVAENPSSEFEAGDHFASFCRTDAEVGAELFGTDSGESFSAIVPQKPLANFDGAVSARSCTKNNGKQFRGAHFSGSVSNEFLARPINGGKINYFGHRVFLRAFLKSLFSGKNYSPERMFL